MTTIATRTGYIGDVYYYSARGNRKPDAGKDTIDGMVRDSARWPDEYLQYIGTNGYVTWAHRGREIDDPFC